jgi:DNA-binding MarR family transcriptional regulator
MNHSYRAPLPLARVSFVKKNERPGPPPGSGTTAFLLAQIGAHAAAKFAGRLASLGLVPPHAGILQAIGSTAGISQQALAARLGILPSRLVVLVDELQEKRFVERRDSPDDRRVYELHLGDKGRQALEAIGRAASAHDEGLLEALDNAERTQLRTLLLRIAEQQGLTPGVHPGYRQLGPPASGGPPASRGPRGKR